MGRSSTQRVRYGELAPTCPKDKSTDGGFTKALLYWRNQRRPVSARWLAAPTSFEAYFYAGIKRLLAGDKTGAADLFDTCTRFDIRSFVEDELARIKLKEWAGKPESH